MVTAAKVKPKLDTGYKGGKQDMEVDSSRVQDQKKYRDKETGLKKKQVAGSRI